MQVIGMKIEKYIGKTVDGHNCNFVYSDCEKEKYVDLKNKYDLLVKKYDDEHRANKRLMARINEKEEINEKIEEKIANKKAKITDLYDFKNGRLVLKK